MNKKSGKKKPDLLKQLRRAFSGLGRCRLLKLRDAYRLVGDSVRVPYEGFPIELMLGKGGKKLHLLTSPELVCILLQYLNSGGF